MSKVDEMQNLVEEIVQTISSREVAEMMEVQHKDLLKKIDNINEVFGGENIRYEKYWIESTFENRGKQYREFQVTKLGCEFLAHKSTGEKGIVFTDRYMTRFQQMEQYIKEQQPQLTEKQMLQLQILNGDEMERIGALKQYEGVIKKPLIETIEKQSDVIEEMKPAVVVKETLESSKDAILVGELAKILKQNGINIGQNRLFEWMRDKGYLIKRKGTDYNMPTQKSMELGLFEIKETNIVHSNGQVRTKKTTKVTGKGQVYFINKFIKPKETGLVESLSK